MWSVLKFAFSFRLPFYITTAGVICTLPDDVDEEGLANQLGQLGGSEWVIFSVHCCVKIPEKNRLQMEGSSKGHEVHSSVCTPG